jgi:acrylyl-CoA reductase (NADPH)
LGETDWGGFSQLTRLSSDWLLRLPEPYTTRQAMAIGTAGFTAALCVMALPQPSHAPDTAARIGLVSGPSGGGR